MELRSPGAEFYGALPRDVEDRWVDGGGFGGVDVSASPSGDDATESLVSGKHDGNVDVWKDAGTGSNTDT